MNPEKHKVHLRFRYFPNLLFVRRSTIQLFEQNHSLAEGTEMSLSTKETVHHFPAERRCVAHIKGHSVKDGRKEKNGDGWKSNHVNGCFHSSITCCLRAWKRPMPVHVSRCKRVSPKTFLVHSCAHSWLRETPFLASLANAILPRSRIIS